MIKILILEDDAIQIETYQDTIDIYNSANIEEFQIEAHYEETLLKSIAYIEKTPNIDAAFIDLNLEHTGAVPAVPEGKKLIEIIQENRRIPIIVLSGNIASIDDIEETPLLQKKNRDQVDLNNLLEYVRNIYKTSITKLLGEDGKIAKDLNEIFWNYINCNLESFYDEKDSKSLQRHILSHIIEKLNTKEDGIPESYNPVEFYFIPPIKINYHTGDIVQNGTQFYVILNPSCDFYQQKLDYVFLVGIISVKEAKELKDARLSAERKAKIAEKKAADEDLILKAQSPRKEQLKKNQIESVKTELKDFTKSLPERYYFLPKMDFIDNSVVDFQQQISVLKADIEQFRRIATITPFFLRDLIFKYSKYYGRQGQPDIDKDKYNRLFD